MKVINFLNILRIKHLDDQLSTSVSASICVEDEC